MNEVSWGRSKWINMKVLLLVSESWETEANDEGPIDREDNLVKSK